MKKEIVMYGADWCVFCRLFKEVLQNNKINYTFKDIDDLEVSKEYENYNSIGVPFLIVKGEDGSEDYIQGFDPTKLEEALGRKIEIMPIK